MSLVEFMDKFRDDRDAEDWFSEHRWPNGVACPYCDSADIRVRAEAKYDADKIRQGREVVGRTAVASVKDQAGNRLRYQDMIA